jgi:uncharacterized protein (TIGR03435 family)
MSKSRMCFPVYVSCLAFVVSIASSQQTAASDTENVQAQTLSAERSLAFDVASVKQNISGQPANMSDPTNADGVTIRSMSLEQIIYFAYDVQSPDMLSGLPDWTRSERYDIQAKVGDSDVLAYRKLNRAQRSAMLQAILTDRFKMSVHREPKDVSIYALVIAARGSKLTEVKPGELRITGIKKRDGTISQGELLISMGPGEILCQEVSMETFAKSLPGLVGRQVVDSTGLTGAYDFKLKWDPNQAMAHALPSGAAASSSADTSGPSIFTAVQEQLGLKLEPRKVFMPVVVIDHVERLSEN